MQHRCIDLTQLDLLAPSRLQLRLISIDRRTLFRVSGHERLDGAEQLTTVGDGVIEALAALCDPSVDHATTVGEGYTYDKS